MPLVLFTGGAPRAIVSALFLFFAPGYAASTALFPRKGTVDALERVALTFGLSVLVVPLMGFALLLTPWGLRLGSFLVFLASGTILLTGVAWYRRRKLAPNERFELKASLPAGLGRGLGLPQKVLAVLLALAMVGTLATLATVLATREPKEAFTEFYLLGPQGAIVDYPKRVAVGEEASVRLVVANRERQETDYRVEINLGPQRVGEIGPITLKDAQVWEEEVRFAAPAPGGGQRLEFLLYRGASKDVYRSLYLKIDVVGSL